MKALILGATGMMGTALARVLDGEGIAHADLGHADMTIESQDSVAAAFEAHAADVVFNCVAVVGINPCETDPVRCTEINALGALYVSREAKRRGMTMVQFSSHAVFDGCKTGPYTEDDQPRPTGVYALTKYDAEVYASLCPRHYVVRIPTMFGPRRNVSPGFVDKMLALLRQGRELRVAADKIDSPTFSMDAARCLVAMLREGRAFGLYHVANEGAVSYFDFMTSLRDMAGYGNVIHPALDGDFLALAHKPLRTAMHSNKLPPMRPWRDALAAYLLEEGLAAQKPV